MSDSGRCEAGVCGRWRHIRWALDSSSASYDQCNLSVRTCVIPVVQIRENVYIERCVRCVTHSGSSMKSLHSVSTGSHPKQRHLIESASSCRLSTCFLLPWFQILGVSLELILGMPLTNSWGRFLLVHLTQTDKEPLVCLHKSQVAPRLSV